MRADCITGIVIQSALFTFSFSICFMIKEKRLEEKKCLSYSSIVQKRMQSMH